MTKVKLSSKPPRGLSVGPAGSPTARYSDPCACADAGLRPLPYDDADLGGRSCAKCGHHLGRQARRWSSPPASTETRPANTTWVDRGGNRKLPAEPFRLFLDEQLERMSSRELAQRVGWDERKLRDIRQRKTDRDRVTLQSVDEAVTRLGMPGALNLLYPLADEGADVPEVASLLNLLA